MEKMQMSSAKEFEVLIENTSICILINEVRNQCVKKLAVYTPHSHITAELFVCSSGKLLLETEKGFISLDAGDSAIVPPGMQHRIYRRSDGCEYCAVNFRCTPKNIRKCGDFYKTVGVFMNPASIFIYRKRPEVFGSIKEIIGLSQNMCGCIPALYFAVLLAQLSDTAAAVSQKSENVFCGSLDAQRMLKLDGIIECYYMQKLKAEDLALQLNISPRQLGRIVKKRYGKTLVEVIADKRIKSAEKLLASADMTIEKISSAVGFGTVTGFYREFYKRHAESPAEWRKLRKSKNNEKMN